MDIVGILILVVSFFLLLALGVPVAYGIGVAGVLTMLVHIDSLPALTTYALRMASGLDSFSLLAIPFFVLAGNIMNSGGIALRLIDFAKVLVGRLPGGLAVVNVMANMLFGAISGSAAAAASAIGSVMTPEMRKAGYDPRFSAAVNIASSTTGMTIPPSNIMIVYSLASGGVSVSSLFMAGYLPGILTGGALMLVAALFAARKGYPVGEAVPLGEAARKFLRAVPSLMLLVVVIGGILKAGSDHGNADFICMTGIIHGSKDHIRVLAYLLLYIACSLVGINQRDITGYIDDDMSRSGDSSLQKRTGYSLFYRLQRLVVPSCRTDTDMRNTLVGHDCLYICEVKIDQGRHIDQIRDPLYCLLQHLIRFL